MNRSVLITGGSSGIGRHLGGLFGRHRYGVALSARRVQLLESELGSIRRAGGRGCAIEMDVTDAGSVERGFDLAEVALGPIDCVVANAGISFSGKSIDFDVSKLDQILAVNVRGAFLTARAAARRMIARNCSDGRIIFIASIASHQPLSGLAAYCASKAALAMLGRSLAREWVHQGINVNVICPGYVETELNGDWFESERGVRQIATFARQRLMDARDLDGIVLHLAAPESRAITGSVITIDDAQSL